MEMQKTEIKTAAVPVPTQAEFLKRLELSIQKHEKDGVPFFAILVQIGRFKEFKERRSPVVVKNFFHHLFGTIRKSVHPSQFVGILPDGLGLVFESVPLNEITGLTEGLLGLTQVAIRSGNYNDVSGRWSDIIHQFLNPMNADLIYPRIAVGVWPRDGLTARNLVNHLYRRITISKAA